MPTTIAKLQVRSHGRSSGTSWPTAESRRIPSRLPVPERELPLLARWSSTRLQAVIGKILSQLDEAGIGYALIELEAVALVYLPKDVTGW
jgi:hypothetical protein